MAGSNGTLGFSFVLNGRRFAALSLIPMLLVTLLASERGARAAKAKADQEEESSAADEAAPEKTSADKGDEKSADKGAEGDDAPASEPPAPSPEATSAPASAGFFEVLGPDTYPGDVRGIRGGSLWLEPSFHGLQWPRNTRTGLGFSGSVWIDSGYEAITRDRQNTIMELPNSSLNFQQGRGLLRVTPAYVDGDFFIQGQIGLVGNLCQAVAPPLAVNPNVVCVNAGIITTDDLWVGVGKRDSWDVKVGRFAGWEVYHLGMGLDPYTLERHGAGMFGLDTSTNPRMDVPALYTANYLGDRPTDGLAVGYGALHLYPTKSLRFELLTKLGSDNYRTDTSTGGTSSTYVGARPTAILDLGWLKFKVAGEYQKRTAVTQVNDGATGAKKDSPEELTQQGVGASLQFVLAPIVEFGLNGAVGKRTRLDQYAMEIGADSYTTTTVGAFANLRLAEGWIAGVGANRTTQLDTFKATDTSSGDYTNQLQGFGALQYLVSGQLYIKAVVSYAKAYFQPSDALAEVWNNVGFGGRLRMMYLF